LRAIPNLLLWRPADAVETVECWQAALEALRSPSILALTRQNLPALRRTHVSENLCARAPTRSRGVGEGGGVDLLLGLGSVGGARREALLAEKGVARASFPCRALGASSSRATATASR